MEKYLAVSFMLIAFLIASAIPANAQTEYVSGVLAFKRGVLWQNTWNPKDAKVACTPDNTECVAVLYERGYMVGYTQGLKLFHSLGDSSKRHFEGLDFSCGGLLNWDYLWHGCMPIAVPVEWNVDYDLLEDLSNNMSLGSEYPLPYDVTYNPADGEFYIFITLTFDGVDAGGIRVYKYNRDFAVPALVAYFSPKDGCSALCENSLQFIGVLNETHYLQATILNQVFPTYGYWLMLKACPLAQTSLNDNCDTILSAVPISTGSVQHYSASSGFAFMHGANLQYYVRLTKSDSSIVYTADNFLFTGNMSGYSYYDGSNMYYTYDNASYRVATDGASYSLPELYFPWRANEYINHTDSYVMGKNQIYLWDRGYTSNSGIYAYNRPLYEFTVQAKGLNPLSGLVEPISANAQLICFAENYSYSAVGTNAVVHSPCQNGNSLLLAVGSEWAPSTVLINDFDSLMPSGTTYITAPASGLGFVKRYNFTLRFVDKFSGIPVAGASVVIDGVAKSTDSSGSVVYELAPYANATFTLTSLGNSYYLILHGSPRSYSYSFSSSGHSSAVGMFTLTDETSPYSVANFRTSKTVQVDPVFARLIVDVYTNDGVHYDGDSVIVHVGGAQGGVLYDNAGVYVSRNYALSFPSAFALVDNRSSWTAHVNLTQGSYFVADTVSIVNTTSLYSYTFTLPNSSSNQQCLSDLGCDMSYCAGNTWYSGGHCAGGLCVYGAQYCPIFCNDAAGCYYDVTAVNCPAGFDSECWGSNICTDSKHLKNYKCSAEKKCVYDIIACDYMCADDVCLVAPPLELCDQSTVVGMLGCLQSGMMNFIGRTYDPMMTIGVALAITVLLTAFLAFAFKGVSHVLR
jgi:hypothetical protein